MQAKKPDPAKKVMEALKGRPMEIRLSRPADFNAEQLADAIVKSIQIFDRDDGKTKPISQKD